MLLLQKAGELQHLQHGSIDHVACCIRMREEDRGTRIFLRVKVNEGTYRKKGAGGGAAVRAVKEVLTPFEKKNGRRVRAGVLQNLSVTVQCPSGEPLKTPSKGGKPPPLALIPYPMPPTPTPSPQNASTAF